MTVALSRVYLSYLFLTLICSALWLELDRAGLAVCFVLLGLVWYLTLSKSAVLGARIMLPGRFPALGGSLGRRVALSLLAAAPVLAYFLLTLGQEFPFSGDHRHHLMASQASVHFWKRHVLLLSLTLGVGYGGFRMLMRRGEAPSSSEGWKRLALFARRTWMIWATAFLVVTSYFGHSPAFFARFPSGYYFVTSPLNWVFEVFWRDGELIANRMTQVVGLLAWLFLLRPLILRKWPDASVLPFCALYFFQKDIIYYFSSTYLEPWSVIWLLLAVEALFVFGRGTLERACYPTLLCGISALFKEQSILLLPWFWVLGLRDFWVNGASSGVSRAGRAWNAVVHGAVAALPAVVYLLYRSKSGIWRTAGLSSWDTIVSPERAQEFLNRLQLQFGLSGLGLLALVLIAGFGVMVRSREHRLTIAVLMGAAISQVAFFYCDSISSWWTGYPRFHLHAFALLGGASLFPVGIGLLGARKLGMLAAVVSVSVVLHTPALSQAFSAAWKGDAYRNYTEHYDSPLFFPIRKLLREAEAAGALKGIDRLRIHIPRDSHVEAEFGSAYPSYAHRFQVSYHVISEGSPSCACTSVDEGGREPGVSAGTVTAVGTGAAVGAGTGRTVGTGAAVGAEAAVGGGEAVLALSTFPGGLRQARALPAREVELQRACIREVQRTCKTAIQEKVGEFVTGSLGVSPNLGAATTASFQIMRGHPPGNTRFEQGIAEHRRF